MGLEDLQGERRPLLAKRLVEGRQQGELLHRIHPEFTQGLLPDAGYAALALPQGHQHAGLGRWLSQTGLSLGCGHLCDSRWCGCRLCSCTLRWERRGRRHSGRLAQIRLRQPVELG